MRTSLLLGLLLISVAGHAQPTPFVLLGPDEVSLEPPAAYLASQPEDSADTNPEIPKVRLESPPSEPVTSPFDLKIKFECATDSSIDVGSVSLSYGAGYRTNLTDRIKEFITPAGIEISSASVPPGNHQFLLYVKDSTGRMTSVMFEIKVKE